VKTGEILQKTPGNDGSGEATDAGDEDVHIEKKVEGRESGAF
jgi:hypothetical protein